MNSLKKKIIASLLVILILLSNSISVFADVEEIITNSEETMNYTEEINSSSEENLVIPENDNTAGNEAPIQTDETAKSETVEETDTAEKHATDKTNVVEESKDNIINEQVEENTSKENTSKENSSEEKENANLNSEKEEEKSLENANLEEKLNPEIKAEDELEKKAEKDLEEKKEDEKTDLTMMLMKASNNEEESTRATTSSFNEDNHYISVSKQFSGITREQIPTNFAINIGDYQLTCSNTNPYFKSVSSDGLTWTWRIEGVSGGTYNFTENGETIDNYNVSISPEKNTSVTVAPSTIDINILQEDTTCSYTDWAVENNFIFVGSLTGKVGKGVVVITQKSLSSNQREVVKNVIKSKASSNVMKKDPFYFFSVENQGNSFPIGNTNVTYNGQACIFDDTSMWQHVLRGTLTQDPGQDADIEITNTYTSNHVPVYEAEGTAQIIVSKNLTGRTIEANQFNFLLKDETGAEIETVKNDAQGQVKFSEITYNQDQIGTHKYIITEINDGAKSYTYDEKTIEATVEVTDNGDGTLSTNVTYSPDSVFNNTYTAEGTATIEISKELEGRRLTSNQFSFVLKDETGAELQTARNDSEGKVKFSELKYNQNQVGRHIYTITEVNGGASGYTYDSKEIRATVEVTDNGDGSLNTNVTYSPSNVFSNKYTAEGTANIEFTKRLTGRQLEAEQFSFVLKDSAGTEVATAKNDAQGRIRFSVPYNQDQTGIHNYQITEVNDGQRGYTYDRSTKNVSVIVVDNGRGSLSTTVVYGLSRTFNNTYSAEGKAQIQVSKNLTGRTLEGGQFRFVLRNRLGIPVEIVRNDEQGNVKFSEITYNQSQVGTYRYTITELNDRARGYTYDTKAIEVTVKVTDNGDGTLNTNITYSPDSVFNNTYTAEGKAQLEVSKELTGRTLEAEQFSFTLRDENGREIETVKNDAEGKVKFTEITYNQDQVGTHNYIITERNDRARGYTYDSKRIQATVEVTDNGNGTLSTNITYSPDGVFNNTYRANGSARIEVSKRLTGRLLLLNQFRFVLKDETGNEIQTVRNDLLGRVRFRTLNYNQDQIGTHKYTITEINDGASGYTYDTKTIEVTVEVTDNGNGTLSTNVTYSPDGVFNNVYTAEGTARIEVTKRLRGRTIEPEQFTFELKDLFGRTVATAKNDERGRVSFDVTYNQDQLGIYNYRISEVNDGASGYTYDSSSVNVTVIVTDNGNGTLATTEIYGLNRTFNNRYRAEGTAQIEVLKELTGRELEAEQFSFVLKDENGTEIETVKNDAEGNVKFSELSFNQDQLGTYKYTISEINNEAKGYTYDSKEIEATVEVTDNGNGTLSTNITYSPDSVFNNTYTAEGIAQVEVSKELEEKKLEANEFSFILKDENGTEIETVKNDSEGKVKFSELKYNQDQVGIHKYTITEVNTGVKGYIFDSLAVEVTVEVTDNGDGTLNTKVTYSEDTIFNNKYETINVSVTKIWNDKNNEFSYRPESIVVRLYANGAEVRNVILNQSNGWKYVFENLDKYLNNEKVKYTISEDKHFGYIPEVTGDAENGFVITNNLMPIGGGNPDDFKVQPANPTNVYSINPATRTVDFVILSMVLSIISLCAMVIVTKKYKEIEK